MDLKPQASGGEGQLVTDYGVQRFTADWDNPSHRGKRLLAEFLGVAGLMVILSGVAGILARFAGANVPPTNWWLSLPSRLAPIWWRRFTSWATSPPTSIPW